MADATTPRLPLLSRWMTFWRPGITQEPTYSVPHCAKESSRVRSRRRSAMPTHKPPRYEMQLNSASHHKARARAASEGCDSEFCSGGSSICGAKKNLNDSDFAMRGTTLCACSGNLRDLSISIRTTLNMPVMFFTHGNQAFAFTHNTLVCGSQPVFSGNHADCQPGRVIHRPFTCVLQSRFA